VAGGPDGIRLAADHEGEIDVNNGQSEILSSIGQGSMLEFAIGDDNVAALEAQGGLFIGIAGAQTATTFTVNTYEFDEAWSAKISLALNDRYWLPVADTEVFQNAIVLAPDQAGDFWLTDDGEGLISIKNDFAPPDPFYRVVPSSPSPFPYLAYGFDTPLLNLLTITVVG